MRVVRMGVWRVMMVVVMIVAMAVIVVMIMVVMVMVVVMPHRLKPTKPCAERITERAILDI